MGVDDMNRSNQSETESGNSAININIAEMSLSLTHENILQFQDPKCGTPVFQMKTSQNPQSAQIL